MDIQVPLYRLGDSGRMAVYHTVADCKPRQGHCCPCKTAGSVSRGPNHSDSLRQRPGPHGHSLVVTRMGGVLYRRMKFPHDSDCAQAKSVDYGSAARSD